VFEEGISKPKKEVYMKGKHGWLWGWVFLATALSIILPKDLLAQDYPTKPINLVVTFPPGGVLDATTRMLAAKAEKILGQPVVVANVGGGGGSVALGSFAKEKPDGYHLVSCVTTGLIRIPQMRPVPYKLEDFVPVLHFAQPQTAIFVKSDAPWKTLKELVEYARQNPGKVNYTTSGVGSPMHMIMEFIGRQEKIQWTHVPYPGGGPALSAVLGGHVTAMSDSDGFPSAKEGSLRILASHGEKRLKGFPNVPTVRELGYDIFNEATFLIMAPKGTPEPIIKKLDAAFHKAMEDPELPAFLDNIEMQVSYRNSQETKKYLEELYGRIGKMIKDFNIPVEK
jgi:tripartite-type tricarboxylate transporter receptor subunit TctC